MPLLNFPAPLPALFILSATPSVCFFIPVTSALKGLKPNALASISPNNAIIFVTAIAIGKIALSIGINAFPTALAANINCADNTLN